LSGKGVIVASPYPLEERKMVAKPKDLCDIGIAGQKKCPTRLAG
jgi:hypothetical protein